METCMENFQVLQSGIHLMPNFLSKYVILTLSPPGPADDQLINQPHQCQWLLITYIIMLSRDMSTAISRRNGQHCSDYFSKNSNYALQLSSILPKLTLLGHHLEYSCGLLPAHHHMHMHTHTPIPKQLAVTQRAKNPQNDIICVDLKYLPPRVDSISQV